MQLCYIDLQGTNNKELLSDLKGRLVLPTDLAALDVCEKNRLEYEICDCFYDQNMYDHIFNRVLSVLIQLIYDTKLFPESGIKDEGIPVVNPLYIIIKPLLALYGGTLLKIYELNNIMNYYKDDTCIFLETISEEKSALPVLDYAEIVQFIDANRKKYKISPISKPIQPTRHFYKPSFRYRVNRLKNLLSIKLDNTKNLRFGKNIKFELYTTFIPNKKDLIDANKASGCNAKLRFLAEPGRIWPKLTKVKKILHGVLPIITNRVHREFRDWVSLEQMSNILRYAYLQYKNELEVPLNLANIHNIKRANSDRPKFLMIRPTTKPIILSFIYKKYMAGHKIISLEYADGGGIINSLKNPQLCYRTAPIASALVYQEYPDNTSLRNYMADIGITKRPIHFIDIEAAERVEKHHTYEGSERDIDSNRKIYYLPVHFFRYRRLGPSRELNDLVSWDIQKKILSVLVAFAQEHGLQIVYKKHPKTDTHQKLGDFMIDYLNRLNIRIVDGYVEERIDDIGFVVSNYFGSGLWRCFVHGIPIIYLDFGVPAIFDRNLAHLQKRVYWITCSLRSNKWKDELKNALFKFIHHETKKSMRIDLPDTTPVSNLKDTLKIFRLLQHI